MISILILLAYIALGIIASIQVIKGMNKADKNKSLNDRNRWIGNNNSATALFIIFLILWPLAIMALALIGFFRFKAWDRLGGWLRTL